MELDTSCKIKCRAATIAEYASALMWESKHDAFLTLSIHEEFTELAAALGYRVEKSEADEVSG